MEAPSTQNQTNPPDAFMERFEAEVRTKAEAGLPGIGVEDILAHIDLNAPDLLRQIVKDAGAKDEWGVVAAVHEALEFNYDNLRDYLGDVAEAYSAGVVLGVELENHHRAVRPV